jgi:N-acetylglucosaminyl-diphospho-decaprenol L-rhamnosyltransferase
MERPGGGHSMAADLERRTGIRKRCSGTLLAERRNTCPVPCVNQLTHGSLPQVIVSVVSHGHGFDVAHLLRHFIRDQPSAVPLCLWLTLNVPETPEAIQAIRQCFDAPLRSQNQCLQVSTVNHVEVNVWTNPSPKGFGQNHNAAFLNSKERYGCIEGFCILNPDISWTQSPFDALYQALHQLDCHASYPTQLDQCGNLQDYRRTLPTPSALWDRHFKRREKPLQQLQSPDWVNAAILMVRGCTYSALGGFDTRYRMYCEDVDFCLRLQLKGFGLAHLPKIEVIHTAHRASRKNFRHLLWHLQSLMRLWASKPYRQYQQKLQTLRKISNR